ncbi:scopoletin glucosyltransferase-like [Lotus japonicus]|uniref:scopoletin glucosyltransferase-like n=1 Tax=Lotus japonicus TaxID=34305 RepID=UPI00258AB400|nr:scopoletin glucosyltransferase-like [Lotus japonicus]
MDRELHILFFSFLGHGHLIPMCDMATLFASRRGVRATIVTTPLNAPTISRTIQWGEGAHANNKIQIRIIKFPCEEAGLPEGCENPESLPSPSMMPDFHKAATMLQQPLEHLLLQEHPDCLVASALFPWTTHSAAKFNIPRLVFHATGVFALCAAECVRIYQPHEKDNVSSDADPFVIPHLPKPSGGGGKEITMARMSLPNYIKSNDDEAESRARIVNAIIESEVTSFGVVVNSFYELEQVYADYYNQVLGRKAWYVGPVSLCSRGEDEDNLDKHKHKRGKQGSIDDELKERVFFNWLDSQKPNSVVYVCFGSIANFSETQLKELATGLEASGHQFIWVVRRSKHSQDQDVEWLPEGFERRMEGRGVIIRGWAPQVLILDHEAVGGFVTHCGWNSTLEAVCAGVPIVTWPVCAEQFYNEKFVTEILEIGVPVGVKKWARVVGDDSITSSAVERAINRIMVGEEAESIRNRTHKLAQVARTVVQQNGSSHSHLTALIQQLRSASLPKLP